MNELGVWRTGLIRLTGGNRSIRRKNFAGAMVFATNPTWIVKKLSQDPFYEGQATNDLSNGTPHQ